MLARYHEVAHAHSQVPLINNHIRLLGEICGLHGGSRLLDLGCGSGQLLSEWASRFTIMGTGVDESQALIELARENALAKEIDKRLSFVVDNPQHYPQDFHAFDVIVSMSSGVLGSGLAEVITMMRTALKDDGGLLVIGEPFWREKPPEDVVEALGVSVDVFQTLPEMLDQFDEAGVELVEMLLPDTEQVDRFESSQWMSVYRWLKNNLNDPDAPTVHDIMVRNRRMYLTYGRRYLGWGVFVLAWG